MLNKLIVTYNEVLVQWMGENSSYSLDMTNSFSLLQNPHTNEMQTKQVVKVV